MVLGGCKKDPQPVAPPPAPHVEVPSAPKREAAVPSEGRVELEVTEAGFVPASVRVKVNEPVTLRVVRKTDETCATELLIDGTDINVKLPLNEAVEVAWTPTKTGQIKFGCAMDKMVGGLLLVE